MTRPSPTSDDPTQVETVRLPPRLDLAATGALHARLSAATGDCMLDASAVELLTTPALQVLMAAGDRARARSTTLALRTPSPAFTECLTLLGVADGRIRYDPAERGGAS